MPMRTGCATRMQGSPPRAEGKEGSLLLRSSADIGKAFELPSYARVKDTFRELTGEERAALLALGWYARERVTDWAQDLRACKRQRVNAR